MHAYTEQDQNLRNITTFCCLLINRHHLAVLGGRVAVTCVTVLTQVIEEHFVMNATHLM